ncbi:MAG: HEAT repeat domain-containing protein [Acidobacteriota bacterium]
MSRRPSNIWLIIVASLFIIVPFLTWYFTWFGRALSDEKIVEYLADEKKPRNIQHALTQIESRMEKNDPTARKFYPRILELTKSPSAEVRKTVAWVMGQDNTSEEFHRALLSLLTDPEPLVRRNAALQLVRFTVNGQPDGSGRPELRAMLQPFEAKSPIAGTIVSILPVGSELRAGALLARIRSASLSASLITHHSSPITSPTSPNTQHPTPLPVSGDVQEFRAAVDGEIASLAVKEGDAVTAGQTIATLKPDEASVSAALRALAYVGTAEDLSLVESLAQAGGNSEMASQASTTAKAIRSRSSQ